MIFHRTFSDGLARCGDAIIRLVVWAAFSFVCYSATAVFSFDLLGHIVVGGIAGAVLDVLRIAVVLAILYLYLYCSAWIFCAKGFPLSW